MATDTEHGATPWLAFLVGGLLVAIAALGFFAYTDGQLDKAAPQASKIELNVKPTANKPG